MAARRIRRAHHSSLWFLSDMTAISLAKSFSESDSSTVIVFFDHATRAADYRSARSLPEK
jgi:hypothetical protein